jgi:amino acid transporter
MTAERPPAGWYPNPTGQPGQMYWDGQQWQITLPPPAWPATPPETQAGVGAGVPAQPPPPAWPDPSPQQLPPPNLPRTPPNLPSPPATYAEGAGQSAGAPRQPAWPAPPHETQAGVGQTPSVRFGPVQGAVKSLGATAWLLISGFVAATISIFLTWETVTQSVTMFGTTVGSSGTVGTSSGGRFALLVPIVAAAWLAWPVFVGAAMSARRLVGLSAVAGLMVLSVPLWFAVFRENDASAGIKSSYGVGLLLFSAAVIVIAAGVVRLWMLRPQGTELSVPTRVGPRPQATPSESTPVAPQRDPRTLPAHTDDDTAANANTADTTMREAEAQPPTQHPGLSNPVALGAIAPDAISSTAYGPEQIMVELLPSAGIAAFVLMLPIIGLVLLILLFVAASYRQVAKLYARAGGAYMVARDNFGPQVAQVAAAALVIDYVATVALQCAAGAVAVESAMPTLASYKREIAVGAVLLMCFLSLLGLRRPDRTFAVITYSFLVMITVMIVMGLVRKLVGGLPAYDPSHIVGAVPIHQGNGLVMGATVLVLLRAFANGGSSLTGLETISDSGEVFREPQGLHARRVLTVIACILGFLLAGVAWLAHATHATPYVREYPSMLSEIARAVFGQGSAGNVLYLGVQAATAAILFAGAYVGFNRFPVLASFVAKDQSPQDPLVNRRSRPAVSVGVIVLTLLSITLLLVTAGSVTALVPLCAIGVFTSFAMAGYGLTKHHITHRERGWASSLMINLTAGILSTIVVTIFVVAKFTEGAWLVALVFPIVVLALILLNARSVPRRQP